MKQFLKIQYDACTIEKHMQTEQTSLIDVEEVAGIDMTEQIDVIKLKCGEVKTMPPGTLDKDAIAALFPSVVVGHATKEKWDRGAEMANQIDALKRGAGPTEVLPGGKNG